MLWIGEPHRLLARAVAGEKDALRALVADEATAATALPHGLAPLLYGRCVTAGVDGPGLQALHVALLRNAAWWLRAERALRSLDAALTAVGVRWLPVKGVDTATRLFERREDRPCSDLDLVVQPGERLRARAALEAAGWRGETSAAVDDFLAAEGYNWAAGDDAGIRLELHHRLWGFVGEGLVDEVWDGAVPDPSLGRSAMRLSPHHAYVVGATHAWVHAGPRRLVYWWELRLLGEPATDALVEEVCACARRWGLELPVGLGSRYAGELWGQPACLQVWESLRPHLRPLERLAVRGARRRGMDWLTLHRMYLARLLSGRPSRMGWKAAWRRVWAHPGTVEEATPEHWPRSGRRAYLALRGVGLGGAAARLGTRLDARSGQGTPGAPLAAPTGCERLPPGEGGQAE